MKENSITSFYPIKNKIINQKSNHPKTISMLFWEILKILEFMLIIFNTKKILYLIEKKEISLFQTFIFNLKPRLGQILKFSNMIMKKIQNLSIKLAIYLNKQNQKIQIQENLPQKNFE